MQFHFSAALCFQSSIVSPYISETVHPNIRGSLLALPNFSLTFGVLLVWLFGYFLTWRVIAYILSIPPIILAISMSLLPETPYWLIEKNKLETARKSLEFYRGKKYYVAEELNEIQEKYESKKSQMSNQSWKDRAKNLFSSAFFKPFLCVGVLFIIDSTYSGPYLTYMIDILDETGSNIDPDLGTVMVGSIRVIFAGTYIQENFQ